MNIDINNCISILRDGGCILYPTDTIWGLGCDISQLEAIERLKRIKDIKNQRSFVILVDSVEKLSDYVEEIPDLAYDFIEKAEKPLTIIYPKAKDVAKNVAAEDGSIGIRVVHHNFCIEMIKALGSPIASTSANLTGSPSPINFDMIDREIINAVDYVVDRKYDEHNDNRASQIISIKPNGLFEIIRQ
jgi:L-threonylcarbamoyladenylate synthase